MGCLILRILNVFYYNVYIKDNITIFRFISKDKQIVDIDRYELSKNILYKVPYEGSLDSIQHSEEIINKFLIGKTFVFNNKYRLIFDKKRFNNDVDISKSLNIVKNKCHVKYLVEDIEKTIKIINDIQKVIFSDFFERFYIKKVDKIEITRKKYISFILEFENGKHNLELNKRINLWFLENQIKGLNFVILADKDKLKIWGDINLIEIPDFPEIKTKHYNLGIISDNRNFFYITSGMYCIVDDDVPGFCYTSTAQMPEKTIRWFYNENFKDFTEGEALYKEDIETFSYNSLYFIMKHLINLNILPEFLVKKDDNETPKYTKLSFDLIQNDLTQINLLLDFNFWGLNEDEVKSLIAEELNEKLILEEINTFSNKINYNMIFRKINYTLYKNSLLISFLAESINYSYELPF